MFFLKIIDKFKKTGYNNKVHGEVAQLARAFGSYPKGHVFESHLRYQKLKLVVLN